MQMKEYRISDLFEKVEVQKIQGKANDFPTKKDDIHTIPLLTSTGSNQGFSRYAAKEDCPKILQNVISIASNGDAGATFYQAEPFAVLQDAYAIQLKAHKMTETIGLYLAATIHKAIYMGLLRNRVSPEALKNKFEKRSLERAIAGWGKDNIFEITISEDTDEEGKHPLLISCSLNDYPVTSLKSLLKSLTTTIDQYEQPQHPKVQKDAAHINKHAMHIVRLYYTAFDILEKGEIITHRDKESEELLAIRNGKYLREDGSYAPEFFEFVDALEKRFQDDVRKTPLPAKPDFGKIEELLVEINKSYLRRIV